MLSRCTATDLTTFADQYWGRRPMLSRAASLPADFGDLLSVRAVDELIAERGVRAPFIRMAKEGVVLARDCYLGPAGFGAEMPDQVDPAGVLREFAAGATIVLQGLHRLWPPVIDFVRAMVDDLGHPVQANAYVTPPGNRGFDPHYDVHDVFVLQVAGTKRWRVHRPVHTDPLATQPWTDHRAQIERRASDDAPEIEAVLSPGDALYLPRGWIHSADALGDTSIHLTIGVGAVTVRDVVAAIVAELDDCAEFRQSLPLGIDLTDRDQTVPIATKAMAAVVERLRDHAADVGEGAAARLARRHTARTRPVPVRPLATLEAIGVVNAATRLRLRHGLVPTLRRVADRAELLTGERSISTPGYCLEALRTIRSGEIVSAAELPGLDAADGTVLLRRLLAEGVVVVVDDRHVTPPGPEA